MTEDRPEGLQKNLLIAMGLSMAVYAGWMWWMARTMPSAPAAPMASSATTGTTEKTGTATAEPAPPTEAAEPPAAASAKPIEWNPDGEELLLAPAGGGIVSYRFRDVSGPFNLVPARKPGFFATWPELAFSARSRTDSRLLLEAKTPTGIDVRKEYEWGGKGRTGTLRLTVSNPGKQAAFLAAPSLSIGPGLDTFESEMKENASVLRAVAGFRKSSRKVLRFEALDPGTHQREWEWVGVDNRYFLAAVFPPGALAAVTVVRADKDEPPLVRLEAPAGPLAPGESRTWEVPFYLGPKDYTSLQAMERGLEQTVDFGWFAVFGRAAFWGLRRLHDLFGNYGVAIIALTLVFQTLMLPLTIKSLRATLAMQKLQPKMAALQEKYKDDPRRLNVEMMQLYKNTGTNPLSGCLPMLLQIPIFIAFYNALRNAWELHGAPFALWIKDLSAHDPYYVLPVAMGALMFLQQRMSPPAGDPTQQKVFMFMPVLFTFMFLNFPSGLVLYWMTSSLYSAVSQYAFKRAQGA